MRRDTREVLVAWTIGLLSLIAAAFLFTSCAAQSPVEASETFTSTEMALVDNTARWAGQRGVKVRGEITTERYTGVDADGKSWEAAGWYKAGVAYYNRDMVARWVTLVPTPGCETAANVAAHEVAHALYHAHDAQHWCCTQHMGATPTYPAPVAGLVCDAIATRCKQ